jgi:NADH dehydrogenase
VEGHTTERRAIRVAVIGGTGLVGRHVVDELEGRGHTTVAIARRAMAGWHHRFVEADATRAHGLDAILDGCQAAVFCAGATRQERGQSFHEIQVNAARHLVASCRASRVRRVVHLSSLGASGTSRSAFHRAKFAGEELVRRSLLDATVLRPSVIWGVGDDFVEPLSRMLRTLPVAPLPGRGTAHLQPIAATDVARAIANALEQPDTIGAAYDLPGPERISIAEVYERVMAAIKVRRPRVGVPYLVIEPLIQLFGTAPRLIPFTFDQLAILEEQRAGDPDEACRVLSLNLERFTPEAIRSVLS